MELRFRDFSAEDMPFRKKWLADPEVNKHLGHQVRAGLDDDFHQHWLENYLRDEEWGERKIFLVWDGDKPIGQVGLLDINQHDKNALLYIVIGETEYRRRGLSQPILRYICDYGFETLGLHKISLEVHADNTAAVRAYEKFGFVTEGVFRENISYDDRYGDEIRMAIFEHKDKE